MNLFENLQKIYESDNLTQKRLSNLTSEEIDKLPDQFLCVCYRGGAGSGHPYTVFDVVSKPEFLKDPDKCFFLGFSEGYARTSAVYIATSKDVDDYEKSHIDTIKSECNKYRKYLTN